MRGGCASCSTTASALTAPPSRYRTTRRARACPPTAGAGSDDDRASWRAREDSNLRPLGPQPNALSTELRAPVSTTCGSVAEREGFEPSEEVYPLQRFSKPP